MSGLVAPGTKLSGKVALITGAARGMGAEHARVMAAEGARVIVADVRDAESQETVAEIVRAGHRAEMAHLDVTETDNWVTVVSEVEERHGRLDVLVNNAGIGGSGPLMRTSDEAWGRTVAVNQTGVFLGMRAVVPAMTRSGGGAIVNVSSIYGGVRAVQTSFAYGVTKAAVHYMTQSAALAHARDGIRVNSVAPGAVDTVMLREELQRDAGDINALEALIPLNRVATAREVARVVLFLASDDSSYVTGTLIPVDGGVTLGMVGTG